MFLFLCVRLAEERQAAAEQGLQHSSAEDKRQKLLDSLRGAGVENFTMRAAVPGTEVPGHKVSENSLLNSALNISWGSHDCTPPQKHHV